MRRDYGASLSHKGLTGSPAAETRAWTTAESATGRKILPPFRPEEEFVGSPLLLVAQ
jgi:hypothetical protein